MSAIRTEKHANRKVLYISEKGEIINISKRFGIFFGDGRWPERTYYTADSACDAWLDLVMSGLEVYQDSHWGPTEQTVLDENYNPKEGWYPVQNPQKPHQSIPGHPANLAFFDNMWEGIQKKIGQLKSPVIYNQRSELQGGNVVKPTTRRMRRNQNATYLGTQQEMPFLYETETQKELREYLKKGGTLEGFLLKKSQEDPTYPFGAHPIRDTGRSGPDYQTPSYGAYDDGVIKIDKPIHIPPNADQNDWAQYFRRNAPELKVPKPIEYTIWAHGQTEVRVLTTDDKSYEQVKSEVEAQIAPLSPEDVSLQWHLRHGSPETLAVWRASQMNQFSSPLDGLIVLEWVRKAKTQIKRVYHSVFSFLVRVLNRHASCGR